MSRFIPPHPAKGSPEAKAWAQKMKKARIRAAGKRTEKQYFGARGEVQTSIYKKIEKRRREHPEHFIRGMPRGNPKDFHNIEKSGFHRGEYVGYGGGTWKIRKYGTGARLWIAVKQDGGGEFYGASFADLSQKLDALAAKKNPGKIRRNAKGDYSGVLKLPSYIDRAVAFVLHDGPKVLDWEWDRRMSPENKKHFHDFLVSVHHPLAYEAGTPEQRYKRFIMEYVMPRIEKNPGEAYHVKEAGAARRARRETHDTDEKIFYSGVESAHKISASSARKLGMNRERTIPKERVRHGRMKKNPLAVFGVGNPGKRVNSGIAGVVYSRCLEIRAEKTHFKPGLYRHPFARKSGVQILALDNGDLLVHSTRGVNLWEPVA